MFSCAFALLNGGANCYAYPSELRGSCAMNENGASLVLDSHGRLLDGIPPEVLDGISRSISEALACSISE